ncbi:MAG: PAS domain S-box protein [Verrucomicrobiia bacterium]
MRALQAELAAAKTELSRLRDVEKALHTSETRLNLLATAANIGFWDWDMRKHAVYHSPEWKRQLGYQDHEIGNAIGEWQDRLHPEDRARVEAEVEAFMKEPRPSYDMEFRLLHRDGGYRWIRSQGVLLRENGVPVRLLGVHVDITPDRQREEELRESEQRFRRFVETTHIIPWEAEPGTWRYTYVGPRSPGILGYPLETWFAEDFWLARVHPEDREAAATFRREQSKSREDFEFEYRMLAADGRTVWFHDVVHVVRGPAGVEKLQGFLVDITERKLAAEEHGRLAAIVESSNDAIIGETLEGVITSWNKSAERIYGYPASEVLGRSVRMLTPRERADEVERILDRTKRGEMIEHLETLRIRKDGQQIHVSLVVSPIRDVVGKIVGASATARDITQRKQLEAEVLLISEREQQRIARDLHDGLGQLLSGTVHLANALQLDLAEEALPQAAEALRITELLNEAVSQTRSLARGLYPVRPESNGLMVALQELAGRTKELFKIRCTFKCRKAVQIMDNAVATHLYRIAQEAVANAVKHGRAKEIGLDLQATSRRIVLTVKDDGSGFDAGGPPSNGMGIRIMQYRAGMIGGALSIQPNPGQGVRVICTVDRAAPTLIRRKPG